MMQLKNPAKEIQKKVPRVIAIILTYNGIKWVDECLKSLLATDYQNLEVMVVDNDSKDGCLKHIKEMYPDVKIIENEKNLGTAEGCNIGLRYALEQGADYVALLNQDVKVSKNWLKELVNVGQENRHVGILSPFQYEPVPHQQQQLHHQPQFLLQEPIRGEIKH